MSTCLVTGGAGFLGSHLCDELLRRGHRVICVDNLETGSLANIAHIRSRRVRPPATSTSSSRTSSTSRSTSSTTCASPASPIDYLRLPLHTLKVGSYGTHHTLGLAKQHRARFLLASTSEVYGDPQVHPQPETYWGHVNPIGPRGVYDEAKRYAEALTMAYHRQQGVDTAIVRIFNTYGPRMRPHDGRAIPTFLRQALQDRPITVFGDGSQTRSFCYVDDLIRGIIALAESGYHEPVNIGNPDEFTLLELAKTVIEVTGSRSEIVYEALPTDDPQVRRPDITLARELLGWEPKVTLRDGLRRTIDEAGRRGARRRRALSAALGAPPCRLRATYRALRGELRTSDAGEAWRRVASDDREHGRPPGRPQASSRAVAAARARRAPQAPAVLSFLLRLETLRRVARVVVAAGARLRRRLLRRCSRRCC